MTRMRHCLMAHTNRTARFYRVTLSTPWFWQVLGITACIWLGLVSEGLASHAVTPSSLTYYAVQGKTNPPNQTLTFTKATTVKATLTASDNATWLTASPTSQSVTTRATITAAVNISGRAAGTYRATITVKEGTWLNKTIPVTLIISPPGGGGGGATSSATLTWNAVTGTPISGYKVFVGEAPRLYSRTITVSAVTSATVSSLTLGRTYYFAVAAYNSAGQGPSSNEVSKTIQ